MSHPIAAFGAMGPELFFGRKGQGRWIPYDLDATDENRECLVCERPWPYCFGDVVWALAYWDNQPVYMRWEIDWTGELYLFRPREAVPGGVASPSLGERLRVLAESEAPKWAVERVPESFWSSYPKAPPR